MNKRDFLKTNKNMYSAIHKAAGFLVTGRSLQNGKMSMGNRHTEWSPKVVLYGSRQSNSFMNSAVSSKSFTRWLISLALAALALQCYSQSHQPHSSQPFHDFARDNS